MRLAQERNKIVWVKWKTIYNIREDDSLGIKDLKTFNIVLLEKWKWRMENEERSLSSIQTQVVEESRYI